MFGKFKIVHLLGEEVKLEKFDVTNSNAIIAICTKGKSSAKVAFESLDFLSLSAIEKLWQKAWKEWCHG